MLNLILILSIALINLLILIAWLINRYQNHPSVIQLKDFFSKLLDRVPGMDKNFKKVVGNASSAMVMKFLRMGIGFVFNFVMIKLLGAEGAGVYFLAFTMTSIATVIGRLGLGNSLLRFVAASRANDNWGEIIGAYRQAMLISGTVSMLATFVIYNFAPEISTLIFNEPNLIEPMRIMAFSILPWSLLWLFGSLLQGLERITESLFIQSVGIPVINLPLIILLSSTGNVTGASLSYFISTIIILVLGYGLWKRIIDKHRNVKATFDTQLLISTSLPIFWMDFMILILGYADTIVLGMLADSEAVGIFGAVKRLATMTSIMLAVTNNAIAPRFSALYANGEMRALSKLTRNASQVLMLTSSPALLAFIIFPGPILGFFGEEFLAGAWALRILAIGQFINASTGPAGFLLIMTGHEKVMRNNAIFTGILNIILQFLLIPLYGIIGAALATAISGSSRNIIAIVLIYMKLKILALPIPYRFTKNLMKGKLIQDAPLELID